MQPLAGLLVVDLTRHLPGPFASRELLRLGARVVRLESPDGDPLRAIAPQWDAALNAGKESVVCDLKAEPELGRALCARADVVLEGFRPGVAARLGVGPDDVPDRVVYCSLTGFGRRGASRAACGPRPELPRLGGRARGHRAGAARRSRPPTSGRARSPRSPRSSRRSSSASAPGSGARLVVSMTHGSHRFVSHRVAGDPRPHLLTGGLACYRVYATADGRWLTVGALEAHFFERLCALLARPDLAPLQFAEDQQVLTDELAAIFATRTLAEWLELFDAEDVAVGPVATLAEAASDLGGRELPQPAPSLGEHTGAWRAELGL